jgi:putative ATPase
MMVTVKALYSTPLAERLRPRTLDEVIGQQHLLGPGKPLRVAFESAAAFDDPVGPAGRGQDHAGAPDGGQAVDAEFIACRRCWPA